MTVINTNTAAVNAQYNLSKVQSEQEKAMERLSSGLRINSASDDAAGVAIASRMNAEITGTNMAIRNAMDSQALIYTAEGAHVEVENILQRMRELSVQSANDTYSDSDRSNLQAELSQLQTEIDRIAMATNWGGKALLNGTALSSPAVSHGDQKALQFQVGTGSSLVNSIDVSIGAISSSALGVGVGSMAAEVGGANVETDKTNAPASVQIEGGKVSIVGKPEVGDVFKFDINGEEISVTYSVSDEYSDDLRGIGAQMRDAIQTKINDSAVAPSLANVTVTDNGDGSVSLSQSTSPNIDVLTNDESGGTTANNSDITLSGNSLILSGTFDAGDKFGATINGVAVEITATTTTDAFSDDFTGLSAQLAAKINATADLDYVTAVDNKDGSITITQSTSPTIQAAETTYAKTQPATLTFSDKTAISKSSVTITEGTITAGDVNNLKLTTANGEESIEFAAKDDAAAAGDTLLAMKAAFDGLVDKKNFTAVLDTTAGTLKFEHANGANFDVQKGTSTYKGIELTAAGANDGAARTLRFKAGTDEIVLASDSTSDTAAVILDDFIAKFNALSDHKNFNIAGVKDAAGTTIALQVYRLDGTDFTAKSTSDDILHDAGNDTAAAAFTALTASEINVTNDQLDLGDTFTVALAGLNGALNEDLTSTTLTVTADGPARDVFNHFNGLADKKGYSFSMNTTQDILTITRADGENFSIDVDVVDDSAVNTTQDTLFLDLDGGSNAVTTATTGAAQASTGGNGNTVAATVNSQTVVVDALVEDITGAAVNTLKVTTTGGFGDLNSEAALTFGGGYVSGKEYSVDLFGKTVSIVADDNDGFENSLNGLANKMTQAINSAGIAGVKAEASSQFVKLTTLPEITDARVVKDQTTVDAGITVTQSTGTITLDSTMAIDNGDEFTFTINGTQVELKVGADGFSNSDAGLRAQLRAVIEEANITGVTVTEAASGREVSVQMNLNTATNGKSVVATNLSVSDTSTSSLTANDGKIAVGGEVTAGDVFSFEVGGTALSVIAGADGAELSTNGVAGQIAAAVQEAGVSGVDVKNNGDGSVSFNTTAVKITDAQAAKDSISIIDAAIETINSQRATLGGVSNRLDNTVTNLSNVSANLQSSLSRIQDADFATETSNLTKSQILSQAATAMLAQANASKQGVLSLLQG